MRLMLEGSDSVLLIWFCVFMQLGCMIRHQMFRDSLRVKGSPSPTLPPVIYCGTKYAATFSVFLKSLDQRTVGYASLAHSAKTRNFTTSSVPRDENR